MLLALSISIISSAILIPTLASGNVAMQEAVLLHLQVAALISPLLVFLAFQINNSNPNATISNAIIGHIIGTLFWYLLCVLFGAPIFQLGLRTLLLASTLNSYSGLIFVLQFGLDINLVRYLFENMPRSNDERKVYIPTVTLCFGAWVGSLPMLLDWDRPWQQWPIPVYYGAIIGFLSGGLCFNLITQWYFEKEVHDNE